ncbi:uncharacterized protein LOC128181066 [Crassostrea angulata]|uniref:uncharacterized protein LOC128181066 n=1 Tax=Magallana angulata TaxID=2784310 RepID=UPI0022B17D5E|nr:uncharacterized protein LOC128181066 [Crassostrea angulata]
MKFILLLITFAGAKAEEDNGNCKEILQGYLTGQLSSALGAYQVEALRREFKSFTEGMEKSMKELEQNVEKKLNNIKNTANSSVVYTRWGRKNCPTGAELVLSGYVGGSRHTHSGAAVEPLCLPRKPEWGNYKDGTDGSKAYIYGAEYETGDLSGKWLKLHDHDVPCAVCLVRNRSVVKMFPATKVCKDGWKFEYHGYLMAGYHGHAAGTTYTCIDNDPESLHGGGNINSNGYLLYMVEARCGSLKCPPYVEGREIIMKLILFLMIVAAAQAGTNTGQCKEMLQDTSNSSAVYTRWGSKNCPGSADLVLSGYVGGSLFSHTGAAVEPLCLPRNPEWGDYRDETDGAKAYIYGAEYQTGDSAGKLINLHDHDVPCAVCLVRNRSVVKMFPARKTCDKGWKHEYHGYLMAGYYNHSAGTSYTCVDGDPETLQGGHINNNGYLFYLVEAICGSLKCPPYVNGRELVCVVCSLEK